MSPLVRFERTCSIDGCDEDALILLPEPLCAECVKRMVSGGFGPPAP